MRSGPTKPDGLKDLLVLPELLRRTILQRRRMHGIVVSEPKRAVAAARLPTSSRELKSGSDSDETAPHKRTHPRKGREQQPRGGRYRHRGQLAVASPIALIAVSAYA